MTELLVVLGAVLWLWAGGEAVGRAIDKAGPCSLRLPRGFLYAFFVVTGPISLTVATLTPCPGRTWRERAADAGMDY